MFSELDEFMEENELSFNSEEVFTTHLQALLEHFNFPEETAPEQYDWIRSPFTVTRANHLTWRMHWLNCQVTEP